MHDEIIRNIDNNKIIVYINGILQDDRREN